MVSLFIVDYVQWKFWELGLCIIPKDMFALCGGAFRIARFLPSLIDVALDDERMHRYLLHK